MTKYKLKTKYLLPLLGLGVLGFTGCKNGNEQYIIQKDNKTNTIVGTAINPNAKHKYCFLRTYNFRYDLYQDGDTVTFRSLSETMDDHRNGDQHIKTINGHKAHAVMQERQDAANNATKQEILSRVAQRNR